MSYAYIVPYEYVIQFLEEELADTYMELPNYVMDVKDMLKQESKRKPRKDLKSIKKECDKVEDKKLIDLCSVVIRDLEFRNNEN